MNRLDHIVLHASGPELSKTAYRRHYCTEQNDLELNHLVKEGMFTGPVLHPMLHEGMAYFYLTDAGLARAHQIAEEERCLKKKMSRSRSRKSPTNS